MTTGTTGASGMREGTDVPVDPDFDPEATGEIPRIVIKPDEPAADKPGEESDEDTAPRALDGKARPKGTEASSADAERAADAGPAEDAGAEEPDEDDDPSRTVSIRVDVLKAAAARPPASKIPAAEAAGTVDAGDDSGDSETTVELRLPSAKARPGTPLMAPDAPQKVAQAPVAPMTPPVSESDPHGPVKPSEEAPAVPVANHQGKAAPGRWVAGAPGVGTPEQIAPEQIAPQPAPQPKPQPTPQAKARGLGAKVSALLANAPSWLPVVLVLEGLVMYVLALRVSPGPLRGVNPADIDGLGLISAMPLSAFAAIALMIIAFFVTVTQSTDRKFLLLFQIAAITFALHGAGAIVADEPRFPTAYVHAGFVDFIARTGETAASIDARMAWPGFFALFAFVTKAAGITDLTPILMWTPLLSNLLYLLPFVMILRQVVATTRARWFAALLFVLVQWIGQDYFSPQGFTFAIYLAFVAILLRWFGRVEPRTKPVAAKGLRKLLGKLDAMLPGELAITGTFRADKLLMLLLMVALFVAATASHQITPFMMLGVLTAFLLFRRTSLTWGLPFFFGLMVLAWISYQTVGFWANNLDTLFGGLGRILENLQRNTGDRIAGSDPEHAMVLQARLGILAAILVFAAAGLFRRVRRGVFDRAALILLTVPVLALGLQSYGGEIGLRIYMFALPGACLLAAYAFFPNLPADSADARDETVPMRKRNVRFNPQLTRRVSIALAAIFSIVFAMAFLVARYGNEKFERVTSGEVAAMRYVYDHDKPSARVIYLVPKIGPEVTPTLPWGERDLELVNFSLQGLVHKDPTIIANVVGKLKSSPRNTYLAVSTAQVSYLQLNEGYPDDWGQRFRAALDASKDIKRVYSNEDAALYTWKKFVKGTETPEPQPYAGVGDPTSPWTPLGVAALGVTWLALFAYEVIRLQGRDRAPRARRHILMVAIPAFVVSILVIAERFIAIGLSQGP
ncbi:hypothetical protein [Nonomuraea sp. NPDC046570]|uniref:hypothetical protein n=1 Tax=Nonomuraea sp. NPDC046570 TaxID=3155255 RepID=UPI003408865B